MYISGTISFKQQQHPSWIIEPFGLIIFATSLVMLLGIPQGKTFVDYSRNSIWKFPRIPLWTPSEEFSRNSFSSAWDSSENSYCFEIPWILSLIPTRTYCRIFRRVFWRIPRKQSWWFPEGTPGEFLKNSSKFFKRKSRKQSWRNS